MEPVIEKFRTALGGFHRGDVLHYIEKLVATHRQEMSRLVEELERTQSKNTQLEEELEGVRTAHGNVAAEEARVRASLEDTTQALARLRGELSQTETKLAAARLELQRLHGQVDEMEPMAQKYDQLKDHVATVELDAHRKAQEPVEQAQTQAQQALEEAQAQARAVVEQAQTQAREIREETRRWVEQVMGNYGDLRSGMDALFSRIREMGAMEAKMDQADQAAQRLQEQGEQL